MEIKKKSIITKQNKSFLLFWKGGEWTQQNSRRPKANKNWSPFRRKSLLVSQPVISNSLWKRQCDITVTSEMARDRILHLGLPQLMGLIWISTRTLEHKPQVRSLKWPVPCPQASFSFRLFMVKIFIRRCSGGLFFFVFLHAFIQFGFNYSKTSLFS